VEEAWQRCCDACGVVNEADWRLARTPPTTLAGVAAVLRFVNKIEDGGMEWPGTDTVGPEGWHYQLRASMAAAIEALIKAQAGKTVQA
jgi:ribonuclease HI